MNSCRTKLNLIAAIAAAAAVISCTDANYIVGSNLVPDNLRYTIITGQTTPLQVDLRLLDSLSGYSQYHATIGAIRDEDLGLTRRASVLRLFPINDTLIFGDDPEVKSFHLSMALDTVSVLDADQMHILQSVGVYAADDDLNPKYTYDCNEDFSSKVDWSRPICVGTPIINGEDSLSFDFTSEYAEQFLSLTQDDLEDISLYRKKIRPFYLNTDDPSSGSGRINLFSFQVNYDTDYYTLSGNYARLDVSGTFDGTRKDTSYFFYLSPDNMYDVDSLLTNTSAGSLPQYALNLTTQDASKTAGLQARTDKLIIEGGGGLKPHISAKALKSSVREIISANGHDPDKVSFSKASLVFDYDAPDEKYDGLDFFPDVLSPTVRGHVTDTTGGVSTRVVQYNNLTDASNSSENQGDIDLSLQRYAPDITYHLQEILSASDEDLDAGLYDIWLLIMYYNTVTTTDSSAEEMSEYYSQLAYLSYYNSMYGGYGSYGSGYNSYSNYYSYMLAAQYASQSATTTSTNVELDTERFYKGILCGPLYEDPDRRPRLVFSYIVASGD